MNIPLMRNTPEPIDTSVPFVEERCGFGPANFIDRFEAISFIDAPKTPVKEKRKPVCPGAPERLKK